MNSERDISNQKKTMNKECQVCGSNQASINYDALCCFPCKMFFRRNAHYDWTIYQCEFDGHCDVNTRSRRGCRSCRMKKCLSVGMNRDLFRASRSACSKKRNTKEEVQAQNKAHVQMTIQPLSLLSKDRSLLTVEQWSLLSNVLHSYEAHSPIPEIQKVMATYATMPPKNRLKLASNNLMLTMGLMFSSAWSFVESVPQFSSLLPIDRKVLIQRNVSHMGALQGSNILYEGKFHDDSTNRGVAFVEYGASIMEALLKAIELAISNRTIAKLFLLVMSFSTSSDAVEPIHGEYKKYKEEEMLTDSVQIFNQQNVFVDLLFKYMIYQYGYIEASLCFADMIRRYLNQGKYLQEARTNSQHDQMVNMIIQGCHQFNIHYK